MIKVLYQVASILFLLGAWVYFVTWKKPAEIVVKEVPVEKEHVRCIQCAHGTRDMGEPGKVYCKRMGCQMMPKAYCSMAELNVSQTIRDKVQQAEQLLQRLDDMDDMIDKYRDAMESQYLRDAYKDAYQSNLESVRAYREALDAKLADLKKQYSRNLADQVRWRF